MAIITSPKFGKMKNKVDGLVFQKYRTLQIMRDRVIPRNPKTTSQQLARTKFGAIGNLAAQFAGVIAVGFSEYVKGTAMGVRNAFVKLNYSHVSASVPGSAVVDYTNLVISKGSFTNVTFGEPDFDNPNEVGITWTPNADAWDAANTDKVYIVLYAPDLNAIFIEDGKTRINGTATVTVPAAWSGQSVKCYGFTVGAAADNLGKVSNSYYIGSGNIS